MSRQLIDGGIKRGRKPAITVGDRFGMLTVLERVENGARRTLRYRCRCDCGAEVVVFGCSLASGHTKSCGCLRRERMRVAAKLANSFLGGGNDNEGDGR